MTMIARRSVLAGVAMAMLGGGVAAQAQAPAPILTPPGPYGMIGRMRAVPGRRADLISILSSGTETMPGCLQYLVCEDLADVDAIWIVEIWVRKAAHDASLQLPQVREAIRLGRPLIAGFDAGTEVRPVAGLILPHQGETR